MATDEHRRRARETRVRCAVVTVSDSRTGRTDTGGDLLRERLSADGHRLASSEIVPDEIDPIRQALARARAAGADAVILTGGTGIAPRDRTPEAVRPLLDVELPGFGELFRVLSYEDVGAAALLSRALAGIAGGCVVFCLPGSPAAVGLALEKLILPELRHLVNETRRGRRATDGGGNDDERDARGG